MFYKKKRLTVVVMRMAIELNRPLTRQILLPEIPSPARHDAKGFSVKSQRGWLHSLGKNLWLRRSGSVPTWNLASKIYLIHFPYPESRRARAYVRRSLFLKLMSAEAEKKFYY